MQDKNKKVHKVENKNLRKKIQLNLQGEKMLQITNRRGNRSCEIIAREIPEKMVIQEARST
jgi:hypothetical protein